DYLPRHFYWINILFVQSLTEVFNAGSDLVEPYRFSSAVSFDYKHFIRVLILKKLKILVDRESGAFHGVLRLHDSCFLIVPYALFKEIGVTLKRNHVHKVEWVCAVPNLFTAKFQQQAVSHKLNILTH